MIVRFLVYCGVLALAVVLQSLAALGRATRTDGEMTVEKIGDAVGALVETRLKAMLDGRFVCSMLAGAVVLSRDLAVATVYDSHDCLGLTVGRLMQHLLRWLEPARPGAIMA